MTDNKENQIAHLLQWVCDNESVLRERLKELLEETNAQNIFETDSFLFGGLSTLFAITTLLDVISGDGKLLEGMKTITERLREEVNND